MSLHLDFEPHSWYKEFAIKRDDKKSAPFIEDAKHPDFYEWTAVTANGNTGYINTLHAHTLKDLKQQITDYHQKIADRDAYNRRMIGEK